MGDVMQYMKFIVAVISAGVTSALTLVTAEDPAFMWLTIAAAMLGAILVYVVPNKEPGGKRVAE